MNNRFLTIIGYYIESCIIQKKNYVFIFEEAKIIEIAKNSKPLEMYHKGIKKFLLERNKVGIDLEIKTKLFIKKYFNNIFERMRSVKKY